MVAADVTKLMASHDIKTFEGAIEFVQKLKADDIEQLAGTANVSLHMSSPMMHLWWRCGGSQSRH